MLGQFADLVLLDRGYFAVPKHEIAEITTDLTLSGCKVVYTKVPFADHAPGPPLKLPDWSPVPIFGAPGARRETARWSTKPRQRTSCRPKRNDHPP